MSILGTTRYYLYIFFLVFCTAADSSAQTAVAREYQLKAAFILNFTRFVEWPEGNFPANESPFTIGILGENPFGPYLEELVAGEKVKGHLVEIRYYKNIEEVKACHILFISFAEIKKQEQVISVLKGRHVLTVSDQSSFLKCGGIVRFFTKDNKIRMQINLEAAKTANLDISSKLLKLSEIFNQKEIIN